MNALDLNRKEALAHIRALQAQGRSFESIATVLSTVDLKPPKPDDRLVSLETELMEARHQLENERAARKAAETVLADRCRELLALREAHDLANESLRVLDKRLKQYEVGKPQPRVRSTPEIRPWWSLK